MLIDTRQPLPFPDTELKAHRPGHGTAADTTLSILEQAPMAEGGYGVIYKIKARISNAMEGENSDRQLPLVYKLIKPEMFVMCNFDKILAWHTYLKSLKSKSIQVIPTYRITHQGFVMTDLTENGQNLVFSTNELFNLGAEAFFSRMMIKQPTLTKLFKRTNLIPVFTQLQSMAKEANQHQFRLPADSIFFVMKPDGTFQVIVADFENFKKSNDEERNNLSVKLLISLLQESQEILGELFQLFGTQ